MSDLTIGIWSQCARNRNTSIKTLNSSVIVRILWEMHQNIALGIVVIFKTKTLTFVCFPRHMRVLGGNNYVRKPTKCCFSRKNSGKGSDVARKWLICNFTSNTFCLEYQGISLRLPPLLSSTPNFDIRKILYKNFFLKYPPSFCSKFRQGG